MAGTEAASRAERLARLEAVIEAKLSLERHPVVVVTRLCKINVSLPATHTGRSSACVH
jgi:hypothetical protein